MANKTALIPISTLKSGDIKTKMSFVYDIHDLPKPESMKAISDEKFYAALDIYARKLHSSECSSYTDNTGWDAKNEKFYDIYTACHAGVRESTNFLFDRFLSGKIKNSVNEKAEKIAQALMKLCLSVDSPWASAFNNEVYALFDKETDNLLGVYTPNRSILPQKRVFVNFLLAMRFPSEYPGYVAKIASHWKKSPNNPFLPFFITSYLKGGGHNFINNWPEDWYATIHGDPNFKKAYDDGAKDTISSYCNKIWDYKSDNKIVCDRNDTDKILADYGNVLKTNTVFDL